MTLDEKIDEIQTSLNAMIETQNAMNETQNAMNKKLNVLVATNPHAAMQEKRVPVVETRNPAILAGAIVDGAVETWTYMKYGNLFLAVSCAHCGLCYKAKNDPADDVLLSVPLELIEMGIRWAGLLPDYQCGDGVHASTHDICIVCLDRIPTWVSQAEMPVWPENPRDWKQPDANLGCMMQDPPRQGKCTEETWLRWLVRMDVTLWLLSKVLGRQATAER